LNLLVLLMLLVLHLLSWLHLARVLRWHVQATANVLLPLLSLGQHVLQLLLLLLQLMNVHVLGWCLLTVCLLTVRSWVRSGLSSWLLSFHG
jgi:hypothetical protein